MYQEPFIKGNIEFSFSTQIYWDSQKMFCRLTFPTHDKTCERFEKDLFSKVFVNGYMATRRTAEDIKDRKLWKNNLRLKERMQRF